MQRNVILLTLCQAMAMTGISLALSTSALVSVQLDAAPAWVTLPLACQYLATMLLIFPTARLMERHGRRPVFVGGALAGTLGLSLAALALFAHSFALFVLASLLLGAHGAISQHYRFAAADAVPAASQGRAISLTLSGGVIAALLGPALARASRDLLATPFLASFILLILTGALAAFFSWQLRLPEGMPPALREARRPLAELLRQPGLRLAVAGGIVSYAVMNLLMSATPLAMLCRQHDFADSATVIQWHLLAMFAPSFLTGRIIARFGATRVMAIGCLLLLASVGVALSGSSLGQFELALVLLGVGWNFLYIAASTVLAETCRRAEKPLLQGGNDTLVFLAVTLSTLAAGPLMHNFSWETVNLIGAVPVLLLLAATLHRVFRPAARREATYPARDSWIGGQGTSPYEQKTQQSPALGLSSTRQPSHS